MTPPEHIGKYVDLNLVGFGTYGSVYRAWDPDLDRYVAIKVMNAQFSQTGTKYYFVKSSRDTAGRYT